MDDDNPPGKVLVRTFTNLKPNKLFNLEFNFHLIDLKTKKMELNYIPAIPLMKGGGFGKMAMLESESDSSIYILGGVLSPTVFNQSNKIYEEEEDKEEDMTYFHRNSSKYSLVSKRWDAFDVPLQTNYCSVPATIFGKLYFFGAPLCPPKVFEYGWKDLDLPPHLVDRSFSFPVLPDRINNRYLVHFFESGEIHAFHPNSSSSYATATSKAAAAAEDWTFVAGKLYKRWTQPVAVSGNILFFHESTEPALIIAYDMSTNKWLEIVPDFTRVGKTISLFDDLFTLPENHDVLCLASAITIRSDEPSAVDILRLRFNHTVGSNQLTLTALDYQSYDIPLPSRVYDFLLL